MFRRLPAALALVLALAPAGAASKPGLLVTTGEVTATTAVVWVRSEGRGEVSIEARPVAGAAVTGVLRITGRNDSPGKLLLAGLRPATRYAWQVRAAAQTVKGEFVTAPAHDQAARVAFLWSGDLGGAGLCRRVDGGYRIFKSMARQRPDFFLFVGDTVYADRKCDGCSRAHAIRR